MADTPDEAPPEAHRRKRTAPKRTAAGSAPPLEAHQVMRLPVIDKGQMIRDLLHIEFQNEWAAEQGARRRNDANGWAENIKKKEVMQHAAARACVRACARSVPMLLL